MESNATATATPGITQRMPEVLRTLQTSGCTRSASCNPRAWVTNTWHHVQVYYSRDDSGNITYHSVWLDGQQSNINATVNSAFALGWAPVLLTNFQVDGLGSTGSPAVYVDAMTVSRW